jgi:hypothetical protein
MLTIQQRNLANFQKKLMTKNPKEMHISNHFVKKEANELNLVKREKTNLEFKLLRFNKSKPMLAGYLDEPNYLASILVQF